MGRLVEYILLLLSVVLVVFALTGSTNIHSNSEIGFTNCSVTDTFITIDEIQLIPPLPLIRGTNVNLRGIVHIHKKIDWMLAKFLITYNFRHELSITFVNQNLNGCDLIADVLKQNCPLLPGRYNLNAIQEVLKLYWPGFYEGKFTIYNKNGDQLFCGEMSLLMK